MIPLGPISPGARAGGRTRFLASVRTAAEARLAVAGGADIVDAKEPAAGALGAVATAELAAIIAAVDGRCPVSATTGDHGCAEAPARARAIAAAGADIVKIGLFDSPDAPALAAMERLSADGVRLVAVMFADRAPDWREIPRLAAAGFLGVMLDTADKTRGGLRAHLAPGQLAHFLAEARSHGLLAGLAGSLTGEDAAALMPLAPDVLGFRGALCASGLRVETLELQRVEAICRIVGWGAAAERAAPVS